MCEHKEWMKICVLCGDVLETTENRAKTIASAEMSKTVFIAAEHSAHLTGGQAAANIGQVALPTSR